MILSSLYSGFSQVNETVWTLSIVPFAESSKNLSWDMIVYVLLKIWVLITTILIPSIKALIMDNTPTTYENFRSLVKELYLFFKKIGPLIWDYVIALCSYIWIHIVRNITPKIWEFVLYILDVHWKNLRQQFVGSYELVSNDLVPIIYVDISQSWNQLLIDGWEMGVYIAPDLFKGSQIVTNDCIDACKVVKKTFVNRPELASDIFFQFPLYVLSSLWSCLRTVTNDITEKAIAEATNIILKRSLVQKVIFLGETLNPIKGRIINKLLLQ